MSGAEEDSIQKMESRFRDVAQGKPEIDYTHLYPNRWAFSIKIQDSGYWGYIENTAALAILQI